MQALSDDQHIAAIEAKVDRMEKKVDDGFSEMRAEFTEVRTEIRSEVMAARSEARADFRFLIGILLPMYLTIILGFAALLLQHHV